MCDLLKVSRSGYYDWMGRSPSERSRKHARILKKIKAIHKKFPMYGVDPIWAEVKESIPCKSRHSLSTDARAWNTVKA